MHGQTDHLFVCQGSTVNRVELSPDSYSINELIHRPTQSGLSIVFSVSLNESFRGKDINVNQTHIKPLYMYIHVS